MTYLQCLAELDSMVALATNETRRNLAAVNKAGSVAATIDYHSVDDGLAELESRCPPIPQIAHNRGVLAARTERWSEAVSHLERSLSQDPRAAGTHRLLRGIHDYQAALAYARALDIPVETGLPRLDWQDSTSFNADGDALNRALHEDARNTALRSISNVDYELFSWWHAMRASDDIRPFYVDDFPAASISRSRQLHAGIHWQSVQRVITFTAQDAVAVLSDAQQRRTLLLLRLVGTRWKIYQEMRL